MRELAELQKDVDLLKMLFSQRASTHRYLEELFRIRNKWEKRITFPEFKKLTTQIDGKAFDRRITKTRIRILIELSCPAKAEKSRSIPRRSKMLGRLDASHQTYRNFSKKGWGQKCGVWKEIFVSREHVLGGAAVDGGGNRACKRVDIRLKRTTCWLNSIILIR